MGFTTVWLVADVQELTVGVVAAATVEVTADGCGLLVLGRWWQTGEMCLAREGGSHPGGAIGLGRLRPGRAGESAVAIGVAVYAVGEGLLLENVIV